MTMPLRTAIIYDFDGTLAPHNLPEHSFLPTVGVTDTEAFWERVHAEARAQDGCQILAYMHLMLKAAKDHNVSVTREMLQEQGRNVPLFDGVKEWFDHINAYGREKNLEIEHYVISSGILEIIEGCEIYPCFHKVFASAYAYDDEGHAKWPASAINYTNKTQFLFRINKGIDNVWDDKAINSWQPHAERRIPFERMLFLGDGDTDIPTMKMVRQKGGQAVAVFDPKKFEEKKLHGKVEKLIAENRIDFVADADYRPSSLLGVIVRGILGRMATMPGRRS